MAMMMNHLFRLVGSIIVIAIIIPWLLIAIAFVLFLVILIYLMYI